VDDTDFLERFRAHPEDLDELLVYADWLEERRDLLRATIVREQHTLLGLDIESPQLLEHATRLLELRAKLKGHGDWCSRIARQPLTGTFWRGSKGEEAFILRFLPAGVLNYTSGDSTYENARWLQVGDALAFDMNAHYSDYTAVVVGAVMRGSARNIHEHVWTWRVDRTTREDAAIKGTINRTIYDDHTRRVRQRKKKRPQKAR